MAKIILDLEVFPNADHTVVTDIEGDIIYEVIGGELTWVNIEAKRRVESAQMT